MILYRGDQPVSPADKEPAFTFEAPLQTFDARASRTTDEWTKDGSECRLKLATDRGEAFLVVAPDKGRVFFDTHLPPEIIHSSNPLPWILLVIALVLWTGFNRIKHS